MTSEPVWGLDSLEQEQKQSQDEIVAKQMAVNMLYAKCFNTQAGRKVIEHLKNCTLDQPTWIPSGGQIDGRTAVQHAFVREGQNSIVRSIVDRINSTKK